MEKLGKRKVGSQKDGTNFSRTSKKIAAKRASLEETHSYTAKPFVNKRQFSTHVLIGAIVMMDDKVRERSLGMVQ